MIHTVLTCDVKGCKRSLKSRPTDDVYRFLRWAGDMDWWIEGDGDFAVCAEHTSEHIKELEGGDYAFCEGFVWTGSEYEAIETIETIETISLAKNDDEENDEEVVPVKKSTEVQKAAVAFRCDADGSKNGVVLYEQGEIIKNAIDEMTMESIISNMIDSIYSIDKKSRGIWIWEGNIVVDDDGDDDYEYTMISWRPATSAEWLAMMDDRSPFDETDEDEGNPTPTSPPYRGFGERHTL